VSGAGDLAARLPGDTTVERKAVKVLLVEDNAGDARLLRQMFSKEKAGSFELTHLSRMSEAVAHLARGGVDIVLLDMGLPDGQGIENLRRARAAAPDVAMIVLTGLDDELLAAETVQEGAQDYLMKGQIENRALPRALRHAIERHRMQVETDLIRTQQLRLRDEFLSLVSHELRSPLASIHSFTTAVANGLAGETNPEQDDYLQIILRNVRQLQSMIEDLLDVTGAQTGKLSVALQPLSVDHAIVYAVETLKGVATEKEIALSFHPAAGLPQAYADAARVRQILTILLDNAVKFTPAGGVVSVQASVYKKDQRFLLVEVSDTGCGIRPEATTRIFEHLYQVTDPAIGTAVVPSRAARRGLGLGLHISRELVTRLGGKIWVTSEPQKGSHFFFTLPIFSSAVSIDPIPTQQKKPGQALRTLLPFASSQSCRAGIAGSAGQSTEILVWTHRYEERNHLNHANLQGRG
jgi:signal transduction histidine kinase